MSKKQTDVRHVLKSTGMLGEAINYIDEASQPFWQSLDQENDRAVAITIACAFDDLLEKLLRAYFVKERQVKALFGNDHILQSFFSKINISYYSGLIPKFMYSDLIIICKIRNRFAHEIASNLSFTNPDILAMIDKLEERPRDLDDWKPKGATDSQIARLKFTVVVQQLIDHLAVIVKLLSAKKAALSDRSLWVR
jgi:DNA-binding MltR family transcriptional regulator